MNITGEAVEVAARKLSPVDGKPGQFYLDVARAALEAAAPLLAPMTPAENSARDELERVIERAWSIEEDFTGESPYKVIAQAIIAHLTSDEAIERAAEAVHYAQGLDDYGVANEEERTEAEGIASSAIHAALGGSDE